MIYIKKFNFLGGRIIKTGIAVFLTALICQSIGWPYMLAVITAIVTIEPTADDCARPLFHIVFNSPSDHEYWTAYFFTCEHHRSSS
ncbi:aromatic acid exporter family protein [Priestia megaterium]